jgi:phage terminase small subunit
MSKNVLKEKILNEIAAGATPAVCADKYNIPAGTIRSWVSRCKNKSDRCNVVEKIKTVANKPTAKTATQRKNIAASKKATQQSKPRVEHLRKKADSPGVINQIIEYNEKLTEKEKLFCFNYVNVHRFNATQSYCNAYGCAYSTARVEGSKLLTNPDIRAEIIRLKKIKTQTIMFGIEDLVEKHMRIAFTSITDFVEFGQVEVPVMGAFGPLTIKRKVINEATGQEEERTFPLTKIVNDVRFKESFEVDGDLIHEVKTGKDGASIKLYDAQKSMDWLERYFEWNPMDKHKKQFDREKLRIERERLALEQQKVNGNDDETETTDDGFIDALNAGASSVWSDDSEDNGGE